MADYLHRDTQGPCPEGYHVPTADEWQAVFDIGVALGQWSSSSGDGIRIKLKMPFAGNRIRSTSSVNSQGSFGYYWSSTAYSADYAYYLYFYSSSLNPQNWNYRAYGFSVRCFRNFPLKPSSSWTTIYAGSNGAGIFHNPTEGVISISSDGITWITIADKNLGATTVYNDGNELSEANCGKYYQRGNNYGFPRTGTVSTSSTQVDASAYGPGNYYNSSTFITVNNSPYDWSSVSNNNLRGGVTDERPLPPTPPSKPEYRAVKIMRNGTAFCFKAPKPKIDTYKVDALIVGGGGGVRGNSCCIGGGGGGEVIYCEGMIIVGEGEISVGCGGAPSNTCSRNGGQSKVSIALNTDYGQVITKEIIAKGGCGTDRNSSGAESGSGCTGGLRLGGYAGGGGGGATGNGCDSDNGGNYGGQGGVGFKSDISGEMLGYGGGGGGSSGSYERGGDGVDGGGNGGYNCSDPHMPTNGINGRGGGAGGGAISTYGGSGTVIIRYPIDCGYELEGGNKYDCNGYTIHVFNDDGILYKKNEKQPLCYLIAGGGGGSDTRSSVTTGGGGGEVIFNKCIMEPGQYNIIVGCGGTTNYQCGCPGGDSSAFGLIAKGGCGGGYEQTGASGNGCSRGCRCYGGEGGGGGAGGNGWNAGDSHGGTGGPGIQTKLGWFGAGGGGSGTCWGGGGGEGGGGGGKGYKCGGGSAPTTCGSGAGGYAGFNGAGGIVIIAYPNGTYDATGGDKSVQGNFTYHCFTTDGTFVLNS